MLLCCSSSPVQVSANNRELSFQVAVKNRKENAYNTQLLATFSNNLYYSSISPPVSEKCLCWHDVNVEKKIVNKYFLHFSVFAYLGIISVIKSHSIHLLFWYIHSQTDEVKCTSTQTQTVTCQVGYPALTKDQEVRARKGNLFHD